MTTVDARAEPRIVGMADAHAGDIGDEISRQAGLQGGRGNHIRSPADHISASAAVELAPAPDPTHLGA